MPEDRRFAAIMSARLSHSDGPARPEWNGGGFTDIIDIITQAVPDIDRVFDEFVIHYTRYVICDFLFRTDT